MKELEKVLAELQKTPFHIKTTAAGDNIINPPQRKQLREKIRCALRDDINSGVSTNLGEAFINSENLMLVAYNELDQFVVVEINVKIKNMDYNPYDE